VPLLLRTWKQRGSSTAFAWLSLFTAVSLGIASNLFWRDDHLEISLAIAALATAYVLVPSQVNGGTKRTGAFPMLGGAALLGVLVFLSYHDIWSKGLEPIQTLGKDAVPLVLLLAVGIGAYAIGRRWRRPFSGTLFPETLFALLLAYGAGWASPYLAVLIVNAWLLVLGIHTARVALRTNSLAKLNLGLAIIGFTIVLRFFDLDINDALKGLVFILVGVGFLVLNMRLLKQRKTPGHA
jgi:hypothetical protein